MLLDRHFAKYMEAYRLLVFLWVFLVAIEIPDGAMATEKITITAPAASEGQDTFVILMQFIYKIFLSSRKNKKRSVWLKGDFSFHINIYFKVLL